MEDSMFRTIYKNIGEDGRLKRGFSLPKDETETVKFADGALDGITIYHTGIADLDDEAKAELGNLLQTVSDGRFDEAEEGFNTFCAEHRACVIIDDVQIFIQDHDGELSDENLYNFSVKMLMESKYVECVKIGLSILELYNTYENKKLSDVIRILSLSDEFALFGSFIMRGWPNAELEMLKASDKVRGWGRIHMIHRLPVTSSATRNWLLMNGVDNDVMGAYSAYTVFVKADIANVIQRDDLSLAEYEGVLKVSEALIEEGPVPGISRLEDPKSFLDQVVAKSGSFDLNDDDKDIVRRLSEWSAE